MGLLLQNLGESPKIKVIDFFIENLFGGSYSKSEVSRDTGVSRTTLQEIFSELISQKLILYEKKGNMILYSLNKKNDFIKSLIKMIYELGMAEYNNESKLSAPSCVKEDACKYCGK